MASLLEGTGIQESPRQIVFQGELDFILDDALVVKKQSLINKKNVCIGLLGLVALGLLILSIVNLSEKEPIDLKAFKWNEDASITVIALEGTAIGTICIYKNRKSIQNGFEIIQREITKLLQTDDKTDDFVMEAQNLINKTFTIS